MEDEFVKSFIPKHLHSPVIHMKSQEWIKHTLPTLFIGTITKNYTQEMFHMDMQRWKSFLDDDQSEWALIGLQSARNFPDVLDTIDAIEKIEQFQSTLKIDVAIDSLRIVVVGMNHARFLYEAIEYILNQWKGPDGQKRIRNVEFLTGGDTATNKVERFAKWLCLSGACTNLIFVNVQDYYPFGVLKSGFDD
uniref:Uncharacterized protein n=2 Tax=Panagrolaimus sp. JU765 TaxID=591449 RepID=A0AC34Q4C4_9BILA